MRHYDTPDTNRRAMLGGGAMIAGARFQVAMQRNPGAMIRCLYDGD